MRTITFFTGGELQTAYMNKDIQNLNPANQVMDEAKLFKKMQKAKTYASSIGKLVVGVASFTDADITFYDDNTYSGRFWNQGFPFKGRYELD